MTTTKRPSLLRDRKVELMIGAGLLSFGTWLVYDAYENRGVKRPFWLKFLPG